MLRDDFDDILRDFGHEVLVVKQNKKLRCSCWSELNQETTRTCPVCFGLGYVPIIEKHTTRTQVTTIPQTLPMAASPQTVGEMIVSGRFYFFTHNANISVKDLIVEVDWSKTGRPIYNGGDISEVNFIDQKRFENGSVAFNKVYAKTEPVRRDIRGIRIANVNGIKNYEIIGGKFDGSQ